MVINIEFSYWNNTYDEVNLKYFPKLYYEKVLTQTRKEVGRYKSYNNRIKYLKQLEKIYFS